MRKFKLIVITMFSLILLTGMTSFALATDGEGDPTDPTTPTEQTDPTGNTDPSDPTGNTDPSDPTGNTDPTEQTDPTENTDPTDLTDPAGNTDPTDPTDPTGNTDPTDNVVRVSVADYGALPGGADDTVGINAALAEALELEEGQTLEVTIPAGSKPYTVSSGLSVFSNTTIIATGATIVSTGFDGSLIRSRHTHDGVVCEAEKGPGQAPGRCPVGGYDQVENITFDGGTWDAGSSTTVNNQCIQVRHGRHVTLKNLTVQHSTNHLINLSANEDVLVENITCRNNLKYSGTADSFFDGDIKTLPKAQRYRSIEAIHLDFASKNGEAYIAPQDGTPVKNATVKDSTFCDVWAGVGTHHTNTKNASGITVEDCSFRCLRSSGTSSLYLEYGNAFYFKSADNVTLRDNKVSFARALADLEKVSGITITGNTKGKDADKDMRLKYHGLYLKDCTGTNVISNNKYIATTTAGVSGIYTTGSKATFSDNTVTLGGHGICADQGSNLTLNNNTVSGTKQHGIFANNKSVITAKGNTVKSPGGAGIIGISSTVKLDGNKISSSGHNGIFIDNCVSGSYANGNIVTGSKEMGIQARSTKNCSIKNNTITNAVNHGIFVMGESASKICTAYIEGNKSISNKNVGKKWDIIVHTNAKSCTVKNNTFGYRDIYATPGSTSANSGNKCGVTKTSIAKASVSNVVAKTYTGKTCEQNPVVKLGGKTLKKGTDYTLNYQYSISVGKATVKITGKGIYGGTTSRTYKINPKGTSVSKVTAAKKGFTVSWKKQATKMRATVIDSYQIQYSTKKNFSGAKTVNVKGYAKTSLKVGKLATKKTYYVRVRTMKKHKNIAYYSGWSAARAVKTK